MRASFGPTSGAILALMLIPLACGEGSQDPAAEPASPSGSLSASLVTIGGESIGLTEFREWLAARPGAERRVARPGGAESELNHLIESMLVERVLAARGEPDPVYIAERSAIRTRARQQERELARATLVRQLGESVELTEEMLQSSYTAEQDRFLTSRIRLRRIVVSERGTAFELKAALDDGADFAELASRSNRDPELVTSRGDMGSMLRSEVPPSLRSYAFLLSAEGEIGEPFAAEGAWNILQLVERENSVRRSFESVRDQIERDVRRRLSADAYQDLVAALRAELGVELNRELLEEVGPLAPRRLAKRPPREPGSTGARDPTRSEAGARPH